VLRGTVWYGKVLIEPGPLHRRDSRAEFRPFALGASGTDLYQLICSWTQQKVPWPFPPSSPFFPSRSSPPKTSDPRDNPRLEGCFDRSLLIELFESTERGGNSFLGIEGGKIRQTLVVLPFFDGTRHPANDIRNPINTRQTPSDSLLLDKCQPHDPGSWTRFLNLTAGPPSHPKPWDRPRFFRHPSFACLPNLQLLVV